MPKNIITGTKSSSEKINDFVFSSTKNFIMNISSPFMNINDPEDKAF